MNSFKLVTVCSIDRGKKDELRNVFVPDRQMLSRANRKTNTRSKSASFSSELRPINVFELQEKFPKVMKMDEFSTIKRQDSSVSPRLNKEIKSAMLLIENRSRNDFSQIKLNHLPVCKDQRNQNQCVFKVCCCNNLSKSAKNHIENKIEEKKKRWKSATVRTNPDQKKDLLKENPVHRSVNIITLKQDIYDLKDLMPTAKGISKIRNEINTIKIPETENPPLITSISNSLTNFLTIDEIHGAKNDWKSEKSLNLSITKEQETQLPLKNDQSQVDVPLSNRCKRENVLREYMNVYINWRTAKSIQEHRDLMLGRIGNSRIRTAVPKSRIQIFQKILDERQTKIPTKKTNERKTNSKFHPTNIKHETHILHSNHHQIGSLKHDNNKLIMMHDKTSIEKEEKIETNHENEELSQVDADEYSEIDWLQCEDI